MAHGKCASTMATTGIRTPGRSLPGIRIHEAPRGSLGHWVEIEGKKIKNYQAVVPTTWKRARATPSDSGRL